MNLLSSVAPSRRLGRRFRSALLLSACAGTAAVACGGISDPTRGSSTGENVATITGALTGAAVPANAHVALIYRKPNTTGAGSVVVGADAPVVGGAFTMNLAVPSADLFAEVDGRRSETVSTGGSTAPPSANPATPSAEPSPPSSGGGSVPTKATFGVNVAPRGVVGGTISEAMSAAIGGFVVYVDTNGNNTLDLVGEYADSPDNVIGGNEELILAYLKGGGALDYEKLRDKSGVLPTSGFNLMWRDGERWVPLNVVDLKLASTVRLPSPVCTFGEVDDMPPSTVKPATPDESSAEPRPSSGSGGAGSAPTIPDAGTDPSGKSSFGAYPAPGSPGLVCAPDGLSFTYTPPAEPCPPPPPPPPPRVGLCAGSYGKSTPGYEGCGAVGGYGGALPSGTTRETAPDDWPCPIAETPPPPFDAGAPKVDAGT